MTIGLSPKLYPALLIIVVGFGLLFAGSKPEGLAAVASGVTMLAAGSQLPPGDVVAIPDVPSDVLLEEAEER